MAKKKDVKTEIKNVLKKHGIDEYIFVFSQNDCDQFSINGSLVWQMGAANYVMKRAERDVVEEMDT